LTLLEAQARHRQRPLVVRVASALVGFLLLVGGLLLMVLPGPGIPLVAAGLGLLALEFSWAERALRQTRRIRPRKRWQRIVATAVGVVALATSITLLILWVL
jgi:hypothetical protein